MLKLTPEAGGHVSRRQRHIAGIKGARNRSPEPKGGKRPTSLVEVKEENYMNKENSAFTKETAEAIDLINQLENYVNEQIQEMEAPKMSVTGSKDVQISPRDVASKLMKDNSFFGSDSGIASDGSRSLCTSDDEDHDVIVDHIGDVSMESNTNDTEAPVTNGGTTDITPEVAKDSSPCSCPGNIIETDNFSSTTQNDIETVPRPATPVNHDKSRVRRNALSLESRHLEQFEEQTEEDDDGETEDVRDNWSDKGASDKDDASSEGCWVDDSDDNGAEDSEDETSTRNDNSDEDEDENACEKYCRQYQGERFQVFGTSDLDLFDVKQCKSETPRSEKNVEEYSDDFFDDTSYYGRPTAAGTYGFPKSLPTDIDEVIDFWETDFQVGCHIIPRMGLWEKLVIVPSKEEEPRDFKTYLLYKALYYRWVQCNKNKDHWFEKYWNKSLSQAAQGIKGRAKYYPSECASLAATLDIQRQEDCTHSDQCAANACSRSVSNDSTEMGLPMGFLDSDITTL